MAKVKGNKIKDKYKSRTYSDAQIANAIAMYRLYHNYQQVGKELNIPVSTVKSWVLRFESWEDADNFEVMIAESQKSMIRSMQLLQNDALRQIKLKLPDASAVQAATIFGILCDKMAVMQSNASQITNNNIFINTDAMSDDDKFILLQRALQRKKEAEMLEAEVVEEATEMEELE